MPEVGIGFFPDVGGDLCPAASRPAGGRLFRADGPARRRRRRARVRPRPDLRAEPRASPRWRRRSPRRRRRRDASALLGAAAALRAERRRRGARRLLLALEPRGDPRGARGRGSKRRPLRRARPGRDARQVADQPGDRAAPDGARAGRSTSTRRCASNTASSRASAAAPDFYEGVRALIVDKDNRPRLGRAPPRPRRSTPISPRSPPRTN